MKRRLSPFSATTFVLTVAAPAAAQSEYLIGVGDVLEVSVLGVPEIQYKAPVLPDGRASFPLIEDIRAQGRPLQEVRKEVRAKLSQKVVPRSDGRGIDDIVSFSAEQINVVISEYRPIYITGYVAQPGEQRYRIGMTAREAVAVAGGVSSTPGLSRSGSGNLPAQSSVHADYQVMLNELAREQVLLSRLQAEYDNKSPVSELEGRFESLQSKSDLGRLEADRFVNRAAGRAKDKEHLKVSIQAGEKRLALLLQQRANAAASLEIDQAEFNQSSELFKRGIAVAGRVSEARRTVLLSATQLLQTDASIAAMERDLLVLKRDNDRLDEHRREGLITEMQESTLKIQNLQAKLMFMAQQVALIPPVTLQTGASDHVKVTIFRREDGTRRRITADQDFELMPGDVVEIAMGESAAATR